MEVAVVMIAVVGPLLGVWAGWTLAMKVARPLVRNGLDQAYRRGLDHGQRGGR